MKKEKDKKSRKYEIIEAEIVDDDEKITTYGDRAVAKREPKPLAQTLDPSSIPGAIKSKVRQIRIRGLDRVVKEETNLILDLKDHQRAKRELEDIETILKADDLERELRFLQLKQSVDRKVKLSALEEKAAELELISQIKKTQKKINDLDITPKDELKSLEEKLEKELREQEIRDEHARKKLIASLKKMILNSMETEQAMEEISNEIFKGKDPEQFDEEEERLFQFVQKIYQKFIDRHL